MARKLLKVGGWYLAYEVGSSAVLLALAAHGVQIPGF
jgi:hypothetical protein